MMVLLHAISKIEWMVFLFKLQRLLLVKGKVDDADADEILTVIDNPILITNTYPAQDSTYDNRISEVLNSKLLKTFVEQFRPMQR